MAQLTNKITVLANGDMVYGVSVQHASAGDTITWTCENGPFTLDFTSPSPLDQGVVQLKSFVPAGSNLNTAVGNLSASAAKGRYYYGVAVSWGTSVYTDPGCPEVIIR